MLIHYYRLGKYRCRGNTAAESVTGSTAGRLPAGPTFRTWVDTAGPVQKQLLLDYEEDRLCVIRQVSRYGSIGGSRLWPSAEPENPDGRDSDECA